MRVGHVSDFPVEGGRAVKYGRSQIAVFRFASRDKWYACENLCPHKQEMVLARGILGDQQGSPKVACPLHKKTFSLESGQCLSGEDYKVRVFPVKVERDAVFLALPPEESLEVSHLVEDMPAPTHVPFPAPDLLFPRPVPETRTDGFSRLPPRRPYADSVQRVPVF